MHRPSEADDDPLPARPAVCACNKCWVESGTSPKCASACTSVGCLSRFLCPGGAALAAPPWHDFTATVCQQKWGGFCASGPSFQCTTAAAARGSCCQAHLAGLHIICFFLFGRAADVPQLLSLANTWEFSSPPSNQISLASRISSDPACPCHADPGLASRIRSDLQVPLLAPFELCCWADMLSHVDTTDFRSSPSSLCLCMRSGLENCQEWAGFSLCLPCTSAFVSVKFQLGPCGQ